MMPRSLLLAFLFALPLAAQVETLPPRPLPTAPLTGPLGPRPADPAAVDPFAPAGPALLPPAPDEGVFADAELVIAFPTLRDSLPPTATSRVPRVDLDVAFGAGLELGYRMPDCQGLFAVAYRFLNAEGTGPASQDGQAYDVRTRVAPNVIDVDYGMPAYEFAPRYTVAWRLGGRIAGLYFDSRASAGGHVRQASNNFFGSGAHGRVDLERRISLVQGLSLFGRLDGGMLIGQVQQRYRQEFGGFAFTQTDREGRTLPVIAAQAGLSYVPPGVPGLKVTAGYAYEEWFQAGSLGLNANGTIATSKGGLMWHGPFLRGQFDF